MTAAAGLAGLFCVAAAVAAGAGLEGYSHRIHPLGLLGADAVPGALAFNIAGFILPGLLAALVAVGLYRTLPTQAGWLPRIGARVLLLSALAFAAQGVFSLDPTDVDGPGSGLHAAGWLAWWVAFAAGAPLLAVGMPRIRLVTGVAIVMLLAMMFIPATLLEPPIAQRIALAAWLLWLPVTLAGTGRAREAA